MFGFGCFECRSRNQQKSIWPLFIWVAMWGAALGGLYEHVMHSL